MVGQSEFRHQNAAVIASRSRPVRPRSVNSTRHHPLARQFRMATVSIEVRVPASDLGHSELNRLPAAPADEDVGPRRTFARSVRLALYHI